MVAGLRRASLGAICISCVALADEVLLRVFGLSNEGLELSAAKLSVSFGCGVALYLYARVRGADMRWPYLWCCALLQVVCVVDGLCTAPSGGLLSPYAHGIIALLMVWPLLVPGGLRLAALPIGAGFGCYQLAFWLASRDPQPVGRILTIGAFQCAAIITALITAEELKRSWHVIAEAARFDSLTGLMSRRFFFERLDEIWRFRIRRGMPVALVILDIDHFKLVNDLHGHSAGDEMLRVVSSVVSAVIRDTDLAGRLGGDELVLALLDCEGPRAIEVINRLRQKVADNPILHRGSTIRATLSAGVAAAPADDLRDVVGVLHDADAALYRSKEGGRDRASLAPLMLAAS